MRRTRVAALVLLSALPLAGAAYAADRSPHTVPDATHTAETGAPPVDLTEHDLVDYVDRNAPRIAAILSANEAAAADVLQARRFLNPQVGYLATTTASGTDTIGGTVHSVTFGIPVEMFGQRHARILAAIAHQAETSADVAAQRVEIERAARRGFVELLAAQERVDAWNETIRDAERVRSIVSGRVAAGKKSQYELERIELEVASDRRALGDALAKQEAAAGALAALVGVAGWKPRARGTLGPHGTDTDVERLWANALDALPELKAGRLRHEADVAEINVAKREAWPVPQLTVGEQSTTDPHGVAVVAGVSLPLPLLDRNQGEIARKNAEAHTSTLELDATMREARANLETAVAVLHRQRDAIAAFDHDAIERLPRLRQMADAFYESGEGNIVDLLDALKAIAQARLDRIDLMDAVVPAELEVEFAAGLDVRPG